MFQLFYFVSTTKSFNTLIVSTSAFSRFKKRDITTRAYAGLKKTWLFPECTLHLGRPFANWSLYFKFRTCAPVTGIDHANSNVGFKIR